MEDIENLFIGICIVETSVEVYNMSKERDIQRSQETKDILRRIRTVQGLTQGRLAELVGVEEQTVRRWEQGKRTVSIKYIARLSEVLGETPEALGLLPLQPVPPSVTEVKKRNQGEKRGDEDGSERQETVHVDNREQLFLPDENRRRMLNRVKSRWITGLLDRVATFPLITLRLRMRPWDVANLWHGGIEVPPLSSHLSLPDGTTMIQVYDSVGSELLMLGGPGAGKTTQLLILARELIERAVVDVKQPIPVMFNLASWSQKKLPLSQWLINELNAKYQVPLKLAQMWVEQDDILPLLDGLDEVPDRVRDECVISINTYRQQHGLLPMVVCCRSEDYMQLSTKLVLGDAVVLEALSSEQIDAYLLTQGEVFAALRAALQHDSLLIEMISNPLMLSVMTQVYRNVSLDEVLAVETVEERRHIVFEHYVQRVLSRRRSGRYTTDQVKTSLSWLARQMREHNQSEFYVETLQPDWLPVDGPFSRGRFRDTIIRFFFSFQGTLACGFISCLRGPGVLTPGFPFFLDSRGMLGWMTSGLGGIFQGTASLSLMWIVLTSLIIISVFSNQRFHLTLKIGKALWTAFCISLLVFALVGGIAWIVFRVSQTEQFQGQAISLALFCGLLFFYLTSIMFLLRSVSSQSERPADSIPMACANSVVCALVSFVTFVIAYKAQGELLAPALSYGCVIGLSVGVFDFFLMRIKYGLELIHPEQVTITPAEVVHWKWGMMYQGLWKSVGNSFFLILFCIGSGWILIGGMSSLFHGWRYGLRFGFIYGVIIGLIVGLAHMLTIMIRSGWSSDILLDRRHLRPNVGITLSGQNALLSAVIFGPIGGIVSGLVCGVSFGFIGELNSGGILGIAFGVVFSIYFFCEFWLVCGGIAMIEHYILRWYLWRLGVLPLNVVHFLDDIAEHILLQKVGGGYIFMHRLLLEYFVGIPTAGNAHFDNQVDETSLM
ncbi:helix-turn-helix domain-containing protein [Dictyobacter vulcani]|uniref:helix-turn-helix domain-containing protein n=1 Tax=Dictyobacter vulcani TaxID=2607529 RepID=UPI0012503897|nr:helix-turn-helix domain-containing protein [Dictyobacter vulcani]